MTAPVFVALTSEGLALARRMAEALGEGEAHALASRLPEPPPSEILVFESAGAHLRELFQAGRPIVGLCASGILIRALAPLLDDKGSEPPVLAVAEDGSAIVPLLGGHRGANDLARRLAERLGTRAAVTTASDLRFGIALDQPPAGWCLANPEHCTT